MTYNEWRDELKSNLLSVSESERQRVLDYYAEAYADRREAGFSERKIIEEFGAPYDAAQKILNENLDDEPDVKSAADGKTADTGAKDTPDEDTGAKNNIYGQPPKYAGRANTPSPSSSAPAKKKKRHTAAIIISVISVLLILGLACYITLVAISCSIKPEFTAAHYTQQAGSVQNVKIDASVGEVETVFYDGDKIEIDYHTSNIYDVEIEELNGTLRYRLRTKHWLMFTGTINYPKTTIRLPQSNIYNLDIDMSAGLTTVNGGTFGDVKIDLSAGAVRLTGDTVCNSLSIDLSAGKIDVGKVECAGSIIIDLSAGVVDIGEAKCERIDIDLSAGTVGIGKLICPKIKIDLSAGTVNLGVVGQKSEFTIFVDKSAGKCNVSNQTGTDSDKRIDIDLSAGSVTVNFIDSK